MDKNYDVIIVGAGPGGIFCAYELKEKKPDMKILLIEKGQVLQEQEHSRMVSSRFHLTLVVTFLRFWAMMKLPSLSMSLTRYILNLVQTRAYMA